tara:strand:+ start:129 stop:305 length:177 start_codon:yes stop_codon:yes gene_type:complete
MTELTPAQRADAQRIVRCAYAIYTRCMALPVGALAQAEAKAAAEPAHIDLQSDGGRDG